MPKVPFFRESGHCPKILDYTVMGRYSVLWKVKWSNYQLTTLILLFLLCCFRSVFISYQHRYNLIKFYNFRFLFKFSIIWNWKQIHTYNPLILNDQNLLNIFCQSALRLSRYLLLSLLNWVEVKIIYLVPKENCVIEI